MIVLYGLDWLSKQHDLLNEMGSLRRIAHQVDVNVIMSSIRPNNVRYWHFRDSCEPVEL